MSRTPITLTPRRYHGPGTIADVMAWFDQIQRDQIRVLETNLYAAVDAGELERDADLDDVLDDARRLAAEGREEFRALLME